MADHDTPSGARLKNESIDRLNRIGFTSEAGVSIVDFVEKSYFPAIEKRLARSTVKGYKDAWRCHIKGRVKGRVRDFRTVDGENLMGEIEADNKTETDDLAHGTYKHIKVTLSAMFTFAKRKGFYDGVNPMTGVTIPQVLAVIVDGDTPFAIVKLEHERIIDTNPRASFNRCGCTAHKDGLP